MVATPRQDDGGFLVQRQQQVHLFLGGRVLARHQDGGFVVQRRGRLGAAGHHHRGLVAPRHQDGGLVVVRRRRCGRRLARDQHRGLITPGQQHGGVAIGCRPAWGRVGRPQARQVEDGAVVVFGRGGAWHQGLAQRGHALRPVGRARLQHPVDGLQEAGRAGGQQRRLARQWRHLVLHRAGRGRRRRAAHQQEVQRGTQRVQVGPGALLDGAGLGVLLDGRVGGLEDGGERHALVGDHPPRGAEVQQHRLAVGLQDHVVGRDVAVVDAGAMQPLQRVEQGFEQPAQPGFVGRLVHAPAHRVQVAAGVVGHRHVGGVVGFPVAVHLHQAGCVKAGQQARLVHERAQPQGERFGMRFAVQRHLGAAVAAHQRGGHVLLDRHLALQRVVEGQVDDAETADAQHPAQLEFIQPGARGQCGRGAGDVVGSHARCRIPALSHARHPGLAGVARNQRAAFSASAMAWLAALVR